MLQFTEEGVKELDYSAGGADGSFGIAGVLSLNTLKLGTMTIPDVAAEALEGERAEILARLNVDGILGLGVLRRADRIAFEYGDDDRVVFISGDSAPEGAESDVVVPFSHAMSHPVASVTINGTSVPMIIDTGSLGVILMTRTGEELGIDTTSGEGIEGREIDSRAITLRNAIIGEFGLPGATSAAASTDALAR